MENIYKSHPFLYQECMLSAGGISSSIGPPATGAEMQKKAK